MMHSFHQDGLEPKSQHSLDPTTDWLNLENNQELFRIEVIKEFTGMLNYFVFSLVNLNSLLQLWHGRLVSVQLENFNPLENSIKLFDIFRSSDNFLIIFGSYCTINYTAKKS